jgi:hypothetical protein
MSTVLAGCITAQSVGIKSHLPHSSLNQMDGGVHLMIAGSGTLTLTISHQKKYREMMISSPNITLKQSAALMPLCLLSFICAPA